MESIATARAPFWNLIAIGLPLTAFLIGLLLLSGRGNDYASRLGGGVLLAIGVCAASSIGVIAGVVSLYRHERLAWLSVLAIVINLALCLPLIAVLMKD